MSAYVIHGDARHALATLPPESVACCVTSPPYWGYRERMEREELEAAWQGELFP